ncbi:hypothetical protein CC86DRAFT_469951 [Ophiobolus disseminans]|uniref:Uncharacterized protein n=1 Tax=Ophiobolus disseminans TaxID=1469910 RepID=A0A6A6ZP42_9PLEO|nr:hypothetical protein CC86DRAFT_469951 [Ophiobolus disseminans]
MWWYEVLSLALAVTILVAITTVLAVYEGRPSPMIGGITLNTVVAFALTLFRICLMVSVIECICQLIWVRLARGYESLKDIYSIDMASRGSLGSLQLLSKPNHGPLICLAAAVTIIGIDIGPFFQQSVSFYSASVTSTGGEMSEAFASTALTYQGNVGDVGYTDPNFGNSIPFNLKSAMYTGLYSSGMIDLPNPPNFCPSGHCNWKPFATLAVFVQCFDDRDPKTINSSASMGYAQYSWQLARDPIVGPGSSFREARISKSSTWEAGICIFYVSMQFIEAKVENGTYRERTIRTTTGLKPSPAVPVQSLPDTRNITFTYRHNCQDYKEEPCSSNSLEPVELNISGETLWHIVGAIGKILPSGNLTTFRQSGLMFSGSSNSPAAESPYRSPNITKTIQTIAHYATIALCANDTILAHQDDIHNDSGLSTSHIAPSHRVLGTAYVQVEDLKIPWGWLAFPAVLALIVAALLFETIRSSHPDNVGVWKNNALALLLNTEWRLERACIGAATSEGVEKLAKGLEARVVQDGSDKKRMVVIREKSEQDMPKSSWHWRGLRRRKNG